MVARSLPKHFHFFSRQIPTSPTSTPSSPVGQPLRCSPLTTPPGAFSSHLRYRSPAACWQPAHSFRELAASPRTCPGTGSQPWDRNPPLMEVDARYKYMFLIEVHPPRGCRGGQPEAKRQLPVLPQKEGK